MDEFALDCARPNCSNVVSSEKAMGTVILRLENHYDETAGSNVIVDEHTEICANCSIDLADWWLYGKK